MAIQTDNLTANHIISESPRLTDAGRGNPNEEAVERALRPQRMDDYVGQDNSTFSLERHEADKKRLITYFYLDLLV
jgi:Holliday junction DNA helicase RuvB